MGTALELIEKQITRFFETTGFELKYHQLAKTGVVYETIIYSGFVAELLTNSVNELVEEPVNYARCIEDPMDIREPELKFATPRWRVYIPYSALSDEIFLRLQQREEFFRELSIASHTIRDHFFSFLNSATSYKACIRDSENRLREFLAEHPEEEDAEEQLPETLEPA